MTWIVIITVTLGVVSGIYLPYNMIVKLEPLTTLALGLLLIGIGIDLGSDKNTWQNLKKLGWRILYIPVAIAIGSIIGTSLSGFLIGIPLNEAAAIGAGFGWYSLSGVLLTKIYHVETGTLAFLTNVFREIIALLIIPIVAQRLGFLAGIAPGGATAMDTTLPLIAKSTDSDTAAIAFVSGLVLSTLVPILVPLLIQL